jgi:hypothetical protein
MTSRRLSEATVKAIADLGASGSIRYYDDVVPALTAAGIPEVPYSEVEKRPGYPNTWTQIALSLYALDPDDPQAVDRVIRFATRLAGVYMFADDADQAKLVRLRNALADDGYDLILEDANMAGFSIDKRGIGQMMREIQKEFDKHSISVPVNADSSLIPSNTTIYNGPVIQGDANGAQLAWNSQTVNQSQHARTEEVAPGFEAIAQAVAKTLEGLRSIELPEDDRKDAETAAQEALTEVTQAEPDRGKLRRAINVVKGVLAPIMAGLTTGSAEGAQEWARTALEQLGTPF